MEFYHQSVLISADLLVDLFIAVLLDLFVAAFVLIFVVLCSASHLGGFVPLLMLFVSSHYVLLIYHSVMFSLLLLFLIRHGFHGPSQEPFLCFLVALGVLLLVATFLFCFITLFVLACIVFFLKPRDNASHCNFCRAFFASHFNLFVPTFPARLLEHFAAPMVNLSLHFSYHRLWHILSHPSRLLLSLLSYFIQFCFSCFFGYEFRDCFLEALCHVCGHCCSGFCGCFSATFRKIFNFFLHFSFSSRLWYCFVMKQYTEMRQGFTKQNFIANESELFDNHFLFKCSFRFFF